MYYTHSETHTEETLNVEFTVELLLMSQREAKVQIYCAKRFCEQKNHLSNDNAKYDPRYMTSHSGVKIDVTG